MICITYIYNSTGLLEKICSWLSAALFAADNQLSAAFFAGDNRLSADLALEIMFMKHYAPNKMLFPKGNNFENIK